MIPKPYLLQNCNAGFIGNSPLFWKEGGSGYAPWVDEAKRWTWNEGRKQIKATRGSHKWKPWPLDKVEKAAKRTVDIQDLYAQIEYRGDSKMEMALLMLFLLLISPYILYDCAFGKTLPPKK